MCLLRILLKFSIIISYISETWEQLFIFKEQPPLAAFKGLDFFNLNLQAIINLVITLNVFFINAIKMFCKMYTISSLHSGHILIITVLDVESSKNWLF